MTLTIPSLRSLFAAGTLAVAALAGHPAAAQDYPSHPVRLVVPLTAGSGADIVARVLAKQLQEIWGQPVLIENRPGAGGQIGTREVANAPADGHTLLVQSASHAANPAIYKSLPYDPTRDLIDVALLATTPYVMATAAAGPYKTVKDVVDAAKAKPQSVAFASAGMGTSTHLAAELFAMNADVKLLHVPFKGSPDAITDVAGGRSAFYMAPLPTVGGMLGGKMQAVAVTSAQRVPSLPSVPTMADAGYPGVQVELWVGMWAPAGTPAPVVAKLSADVTKALQSAAVQEQYTKSGNQVRIMSPQEFAKFVRKDIETNKLLVRTAGIQPQ